MSHKLINLSPDLKKLRDEGFEIEIKDAYLLVHGIPYVNSEREIVRGNFVSKLNLAGDITVKPDDHVMYFIGGHPCNNDGSLIKAIQHQSQDQTLIEGVTVNHSFSNKPPEGYIDYYEKVTTYLKIISSQAESIDASVTAKTYKLIETNDADSVFHYLDTNSSRAGIAAISAKLENLKVAIVGLGGTGSYILDLVAKTPVKEIHLFDGDIFLQHNAFRAPGAAPIEKLQSQPPKVAYLSEIYSKMRRHIVAHECHLTSSNIDEISEMNFVFICIDDGETKKILIEKLISSGISFIDVGIGIEMVDDSLIGSARVTSSTPEKNAHITQRISFSDGGNNEYAQNIQIAELNALNAALAVIKWKKMYNFYYDLGKEYNSIYDINVNKLINDETIS